MSRSLCILLFSVIQGTAHADTIYLCEAYSGGLCWSSVYCGQRQAVATRTVSVPDGMPWEQKVALGEAARAKGAGLVAPTHVQAVQPQAVNAQAARQIECNSSREAIANLDSQMRTPQSGQTMDWLNKRRRELSDQRFRMQC